MVLHSVGGPAIDLQCAVSLCLSVYLCVCMLAGHMMMAGSLVTLSHVTLCDCAESGNWFPVILTST